MQVQRWHSGKLALLWGLSLAVLALLLFARPAECNDVAIALWLVLIAPLGRWTWKWFDARETAGLEESTSEKAERWGWLSRFGKGAVILLWLLLTLGLFAAYWDCRSISLQLP